MTETTEPTNRRTLYGFIRDRLAEEEATGADPRWIEVHRTMIRYGGLAVASADEVPDDADYANGAATAWEIALQMLASRWDDHPDYRDEWEEADESQIQWSEFWVGHDDDLDAVIETAPRHSIINIVNHRPGGVRINGGAGSQIIRGISQEEYDAHKASL